MRLGDQRGLWLTAALGGVAALALGVPGPPVLAPELRGATWFEDPTDRLGPDEVAALPEAALRPLGSGASAGYRSAPRWIRFHLDPAAGGAVPRALVFPYPLVERLDLYLEVGAGRFEHRRGGLALPAAERDIEFEGYVHAWRFTHEAGPARLGLLRVETRAPGFLGIALFAPDALAARQRSLVFLGAGLGALILLGLFATRAAAASRRRLDLQLWAFVVAQVAYLAVVTGGVSSFWPGPPGPVLALQSILGGLSAAAGAGFLRSFLDVGRRSPVLDAALLLAASAAAAAGLLTVWSIPAANTAAGVASLAAIVVGSAAGFLALRDGDGPARLVVAALACLSATTSVFILAHLGLLAPSPLLAPAMILGVALGGTGSVLAVAQRDRQQAATREVELARQVEERSRRLSEAVEALSAEAAQRARAEEALRVSEARFRLAFKTSPEPMTLSRLSDGVLVAVNDGFVRLHGIPEEDAVGHTSRELGLWADPEARERIRERVAQGEVVRGVDVGVRDQAGRAAVLSYSASRVTIAGVPHMLALARDVTAERQAAAERDRLEVELRQAQKLEAVGRLAAGVAHDFNNLLTGVSANVGLALAGLPDGHRDRELLVEALTTVRRASDLTRQLLAFTRRQPHAPRPLALPGLVGRLQKLLQSLVGEAAALTIDVEPALPDVLADPAQLERVLVNLVVNARDAVSPGGRILVELRAVDDPRARPDQGAARLVRLAVRDDGSGMDEATRQRIFEPFFTTKEPGRGTGLGLATVYGIVQQHGGFVVVDSAPGRGSSFEVHLPAARGAAVEGPTLATPAPRGGTETVLVVEDTAPVRAAAEEVLRRLGYRVLLAGAGPEALALLAGHPDPVHLLLADVRMPGMSGPEVARRARAGRPGLRVLLMTGHGGEALAEAGTDGDDLLEKPFTVEALAEAVRRALDA